MSSHYKLILFAMVILAATMTVQSFQAKTDVNGRELKQASPKLQTNVVINNTLNWFEIMDVHCKGPKQEDLGIHKVQWGDSYTIEFIPDKNTRYNCAFIFDEAQHDFDIYLNSRDGGCDDHRTRLWDIFETGPCRVYYWAGLRQHECSPWN